MQQATELKKQLQSIHRKSYPAYKSLKGSYQFGHYILSVDQDRAGGRVVKASCQADERCFTAAGRTDKCNGFTFIHLKADVFQYILIRGGIVEGNILELDCAHFGSFVRFSFP